MFIVSKQLFIFRLWAQHMLTAIVGPRSFFKAHVDTPQSPKMFGFLVVVLPTKHEGGTLLLRHHGQEWTFDSANIVSTPNSESPHAAFISFFNNVEHEVSMVTSGYRVTLTYNLYFGEDKQSIVPSMLPVDDTEIKIKRSLIKLLNDPKFLPDGGLLGFSLSHLYPINSTQNINLDELKSLRGAAVAGALRQWARSLDTNLISKYLKGADAAIKRACDSLSLDVSVKAVYESGSSDGVACLLGRVTDIGGCDRVEGDIVMYLEENFDGLIVFDSDITSLKEIAEDGLGFIGSDPPKPILWLKPLTKKHQIKTHFVQYGNEASLSYVYGEICLVLEVKASDGRETYSEAS